MGQKHSAAGQGKQKKTVSKGAGSFVAKQDASQAAASTSQPSTSKQPSSASSSAVNVEEEQIVVEPEGPHIKQTTQVETIKIQRTEVDAKETGKNLRMAKQYKDWADRTAFAFGPPKQ